MIKNNIIIIVSFSAEYKYVTNLERTRCYQTCPHTQHQCDQECPSSDAMPELDNQAVAADHEYAKHIVT